MLTLIKLVDVMIQKPRRETDAHYRAIIDYVAYEMTAQTEDPVERDLIYEVASKAADALLTFVFGDDRLFALLEHERDAYKKAYIELAMRTPPVFAPKIITLDELEMDWLRGDWYEAYEDAVTAIDEGGVTEDDLERLRGRVEQTIRAALTVRT